MLFLTAQQVNLPACSSYKPFNAECQAENLRITNFKDISLIRLGIKSMSPKPEDEVLTTELLLLLEKRFEVASCSHSYISVALIIYNFIETDMTRGVRGLQPYLALWLRF